MKINKQYVKVSKASSVLGRLWKTSSGMYMLIKSLPRCNHNKS